MERAIEAERTTHLCYEKHNAAGCGSGNGTDKKKRKGDFGEIETLGSVKNFV